MPAAAAMIMSYYKLLDNIKDEKGFKKLGFILLKPFLKSANKKAGKQYPKIEEIVSSYINEQSSLEESRCNEIDRIADPTANALAQILMLCSEDDSQKRILHRLGYCLGRYIYLIDAYADLEEDIKKGSYNVLKNKPKEHIRDYIKSQLYFCINESIMAFELLDIKKYKDILGNIIYLGLEDTAKKETEK
jgi:predicted hydrocarbon binding protein